MFKDWGKSIGFPMADIRFVPLALRALSDHTEVTAAHLLLEIRKLLLQQQKILMPGIESLEVLADGVFYLRHEQVRVLPIAMQLEPREDGIGRVPSEHAVQDNCDALFACGA